MSLKLSGIVIDTKKVKAKPDPKKPIEKTESYVLNIPRVSLKNSQTI